MTLPRFVLGHNSLIGVHHGDGSRDAVRRELSPEDRGFLDDAVGLGVEAMLLDNHPVAVQAAIHLHDTARHVRVYPMLPYAQAVVDQASRTGLAGIARDLARTGLTMGPAATARSAWSAARLDLSAAGARAGLWHYLRHFPDTRPPVCFLHNTVTDLLHAWGAADALSSFAKACRERGIAPGFVTLNPGAVPAMAKAVGPDAWFMASVNSAGIQMSPSREAAEAVLRDRSHRVVAMSVLGGGLLDAAAEIPRALSFPAVRSVIIGTTKRRHLETALAHVRAAVAARSVTA